MKITKSNIDAIAASRRRRQRLLAMADDGTTIEETPAEDPYPWVWSWDAREQFIGNTIYAFLSTELDGGYRSSSLSFSTNTGFGVHMAHDGSSNKMGALVPYFDIFDEDMTKQDGTSVTSGDLNTAAVSASGSDGEYLTIIYSGYVPGSGFSSSDIGFGTVYWTQAARTLSIDSVADYSSVVSMDNFNIEGDLIYVTHQMKGSAAPLNDGSTTVNWEASTSDPRAFVISPFGDIMGHYGTDTELTLRGIILWSDTSSVGNTNITMPIRIS